MFRMKVILSYLETYISQFLPEISRSLKLTNTVNNTKVATIISFRIESLTTIFSTSGGDLKANVQSAEEALQQKKRVPDVVVRSVSGAGEILEGAAESLSLWSPLLDKIAIFSKLVELNAQVATRIKPISQY